MLALIILGSFAVLLSVAIFLFTRHAKTESWRRSDVRMASARLMMSLGPLFGMQKEPPPPDHPTISSPFRDSEEGEPSSTTVVHPRKSDHD